MEISGKVEIINNSTSNIPRSARVIITGYGNEVECNNILKMFMGKSNQQSPKVKLPTFEEAMNDLNKLSGTSTEYALYQMGAREMYNYLKSKLQSNS